MKVVKKIVAMLLVLGLVGVMLPTDFVQAAAKKQYTISGRTIKPVVKKGKDISKNVNAALKEAAARAKASKKYTVKIPKGTYYISESLKIKSNTILDASGCTIKSKKGSFNMISTGSAEENQTAKGYNAYKNITIKGGTWINSKSNTSSGIRLCRGKNILLKNIDMSHGSEKHMVEMAAVDGVKIIGCKFHDSDVKDSSEKCEAIQIDICANETAFTSLKFDGTPCKNITIEGNTFQNLSRGIGTHSLLLNSYIENVKIQNNTFENITQEAIACLNYKNALISGNVMNNVGGGILFHYSKTTAKSIYTSILNGKKPYEAEMQPNANSIIENNKMDVRYHALCDKNVGIELYGRNIEQEEASADQGKVPVGDYYVEGVTVQGNEISASGYGIILSDAKNNKIIGNTITGANYDAADPNKGTYNGIRVTVGSTENVINDNQISNIDQTGILIYNYASASTVDGNTVTNCTAYGIRLNMNCKVTQSMQNNTVSGCPKGAIMTGTKSGCFVEGGIMNNKVS